MYAYFTALRNWIWALGLVALAGGLGAQDEVPAPLVEAKVRYVAPAKGQLGLFKQACPDDAGEVTGIRSVNVTNGSLGAANTGGPIAYENLPEIIYLCRGDGFTIDYAEGSGSFEGEGDPNPGTEPGISYGVYGCSPSVDGPTSDDLNADPCLKKGGLPPFESDILTYLVPAGYTASPASYDAVISNSTEQDIPSLFPDPATGRPTPQLLIFAPTTVDALGAPGTADEGRPIFEGVDTVANPGGIPGCTNVSLDQTIGVVYLNAITAENATQSGCTGSFTVYGGVSEYENTGGYSITITNDVTGERAELELQNHVYVHGEVVNYTVPSAGNYTVSIGDAISCGTTETVTHVGVCEPPVDVCTSDAGLIQGYTNINVSSNTFGGAAPGSSRPYDASIDTIWLCAGDEVTLDHDESSADLSGDPDPTTPGGIGYVLYTCTPTAGNDGPDYDDILRDPCIYTGVSPDSFEVFRADGGAPSPNYNITVPNDTEDSDPGDPLQLFTLAPITVNFYNETTGRFSFESTDPDGQPRPACINVSLDRLVTIARLDEIRVENLDASPSGCEGSFTVVGGRSKLIGTNDYTVTLTNTDNNQVITLPGNYSHNDVVSYTVPDDGTYAITVSDGVSCEGAATVTHTSCEPPPAADLEIEVTTTNVSCAGDNDGTLTVTVAGGEPNYSVSYTRTNPTPTVTQNTTLVAPGSFTFDELQAGFYNVRVEDNAGTVVDSTSIRIDDGAPFDVDIERVVSGQCDNNNTATLVAVVEVDGDRIVNPSTQGYSVSWSTGATTDTVTVTPNRTYTVVVTDAASGCEVPASITPTRASTLVIDVNDSTTDPATCSGAEDGNVTVQVDGGVRGDDGYRFVWSDGVEQTGVTAQRNNLNPGDYFVEVFDDAGCSDSRTFNIAADKVLVATIDSSGVSCFGDTDGTITLVASTDGAGPDLPYRAGLLDEAGTEVVPVADIAGTRRSFEDLPAGTYVVVLQDSDPEMCETRDTVTVSEPEELIVEDVATTDVGCLPGEVSGAEPIFTGGTGPYTFRYINDSITQPGDSSRTFDTITVDNLARIDTLEPSPFYRVIITDANGCQDSTTFEINSPPQATVQPIETAFVSCPDDSDGQLSVTATPPPGDSITITDYTWYRVTEDNELGEEVAVGRVTGTILEVGLYVVEISLSNGCTSQYFGVVQSPGLVQLDSVTINPPSCLGSDDGSIFPAFEGGTPNADGSYNYVWSDLGDEPTRNRDRTGLAAGTYRVIVTDANGCQPAFDTTFVLEEPVGIVGDFSIEDVSCPDDETTDGAATFTAELSDGSTSTFDFNWSNGETATNQASSTITNLARGPISVTVTDGECPQVFTDTIGSPDEFAVETINLQDASCAGLQDGGATLLVSGGTPDYTYRYFGFPDETTNTLENVAAGIYPLTITDAAGCVSDTFPIIISEPDSLVLAVDLATTTPTVTCFGDEDGSIGIFIASSNNNPLGEDPYSWSDGIAGDGETLATELAPGTYGVTVTDVQGCQDSLNYTIFEPDSITFAVEDILDPLCFGQTTEVRLDTAFGGQGSDLRDYTFMINNDGFLTPADQPGVTFAGPVIVTVFDSVGCSSEQTFTVQEPEEVIIDLPNRILVELGDSLTQLNPIISPANGVYDYRWTAPRFEPLVPFLSNDSIQNPFLITPTQNIEYVLTVTNENGCQAIEDIFVEIDANRNVFIPNVFSPNNDGRNDDFRIYACSGVIGIENFNIYDRWGGLIAASDTPIGVSCLDGTPLWDGSAPGTNGEIMDPGVYVYTIEVAFIDGVSLIYRGDVTIAR